MKKIQTNIRFILPALIMALLPMSCSKDFLDVPVQGQATAGSDPAVAEKLVTGVYNSLLNGSAFGGEGDIHGISFVTATIIMTDDSDKGSTAGDQPGIGDLDNFNISPTNNFVAALWSGYYNGIAKANQALKAIENATIGDETKIRFQAEVRFIRAYYYFNLVRFFGDVPKVLQVPNDAHEANNDPVYSVRAPTTEIYDLIIDDLNYGITNLPLKSGQQVGRVSKGSAQALLAKVHLTRKNWQEAYNLAMDVINSGQYALLADYSKIWRQEGDNNIESIFEVQTGQFNNSEYGVDGYCVWQGPRVGGKGGWQDLGYGFNNPSLDLVNAYEEGDVRKDATIIFIDNSGEFVGTTLFDGFRVPSQDSVQNSRYNYKAYHSENDDVESYVGNRDRKRKNLHILRLADVILMAAESANELGQTGDAASLLNQIRHRVNLADSPAGTQSELREAIYKERRIELAMEHSRWFDLVRTGRAAEVMIAAGKPFDPVKHILLPVPSLQIALSGGKLTQNPGY